MRIEQQLKDCVDLPLHPVNLRRIFTLLLRSHYSDPTHYGEFRDDLGCIKWQEGDDAFVIKPKEIYDDSQDLGDGIYVDFSYYRPKRMAVDHRSQPLSDGSGFTYTERVESEIVMTHIRNTPDQALMLATESMFFLFGIRDPLVHELRLFQGFDLGAVTPAALQDRKNPSKDFSVDFSVRLEFNLSVTSRLEGHRLKKFGMTLNAAEG